jgi:hypothetical protein
MCSCDIKPNHADLVQSMCVVECKWQSASYVAKRKAEAAKAARGRKNETSSFVSLMSVMKISQSLTMIFRV